ncbi:hypothetical protein N7535_000129 [Penicillium sp. DV-2018c]|nr:hypothetical protein N7461_006627 [Penicillium sp. DV-2018c]KAJ5581509.1 hypothetical protein N7535_000129 [Penicillium sp. DV-2018c]
MNEVIKHSINTAQGSFGGRFKTDYNIVFFDIDALFGGHRFCEPSKSYSNSWFFVMWAADALADGTVVPEPSSTEGGIDITSYWRHCQTTGADIWTGMRCEYSKAVHDGTPMGQADVVDAGDDYSVMLRSIASTRGCKGITSENSGVETDFGWNLQARDGSFDG